MEVIQLGLGSSRSSRHEQSIRADGPDRCHLFLRHHPFQATPVLPDVVVGGGGVLSAAIN